LTKKKGTLKTPEYLKLNPNGLIPVLVDGELVLYETAAVVLHLVDTHPSANLAPKIGTAERAHFYKWLMWLTNTLQAALILYFYPERYVNDGNTSAASELKENIQKKIGGYLQQLDDQIVSHSKPWILGEEFRHRRLHLHALPLEPRLYRQCRETRARLSASRPLLAAHACTRRNETRRCYGAVATTTGIASTWPKC
jgi:glutathione S-transferase